MQRNRIVCIDLGSNTVKAVVGAKNGEILEVVASASVAAQGVVCGVVTDLEKCTNALKKVFDEVKARETDFVVVGLSGYYVESTKSTQSKYIAEGSRVKKDDLYELFEKAEEAYLKEEQKQLDVVLKYYNVDDLSNLQNPEGMQGVKLEALYNIFSYRKTLLKNIEQCIQDAGFSVGKFVFSSCRIADILFSEDEKEIGVLVLDIGADTTRASIFVDNALYASFAVPFGGRSVTLDIKNSYPITLKQAESLKKQFSCALEELAEENTEVGFKSSDEWGGRSLRVSQLAGVVQCRLDEIFRGIRYQLRKLDLEDLIELVVFTGGGAEENAMKDYLGKCFQTPAKIAEIQENLLEGITNLSATKYANVLGILYHELNQEDTEEEKEFPGFFERVAYGFRNLFGKKSSGEDTKM